MLFYMVFHALCDWGGLLSTLTHSHCHTALVPTTGPLHLLRTLPRCLL